MGLMSAAVIVRRRHYEILHDDGRREVFTATAISGRPPPDLGRRLPLGCIVERQKGNLTLVNRRDVILTLLISRFKQQHQSKDLWFLND